MTTSAELAIELPVIVQVWPTQPANSSWTSGKALLPFHLVTTGIWQRSASARTWSDASEVIAPPPTTMTGRVAAIRKSTARSTVSGSGTGGRRGYGAPGRPATEHRPCAVRIGLMLHEPLGGRPVQGRPPPFALFGSLGHWMVQAWFDWFSAIHWSMAAPLVVELPPTSSACRLSKLRMMYPPVVGSKYHSWLLPPLYVYC